MKTGFYKFQLDPFVMERLPKLGFKAPTEVQSKVIPHLVQKRNLIVEAATGTGKTAAYGLPVLSRINFLKKSVQALILVPSRELANQVCEALRSYTANKKLKIDALYGGGSIQSARDKIKKEPHILVAVPGRLRDALSDKKLDWFWRDIQYLIIDEADKLLESGFQHELDLLTGQVRKRAQVALFSATISKDVEGMIKERFENIMTIRLSFKEALKNITFHEIKTHGGKKELYLAALLQKKRLKRVIVFCNKRDEVYSLAGMLRGAGFKTEAYHGHLDQQEREAVMSRFKDGKVEVLVGTDLAARGLDVVDLEAVINFSIPDDREVYLHRAGRTGRAGMKGSCYNISSSKEEAIYLDGFHREIDIRQKVMEIVPMKSEALKAIPLDKLVKVHVNRGKKDKIRKGDIVGFLINATSIKADSIGTITLYDEYVTVDIPETALEDLYAIGEKHKIKGKTVKIRKYGLDEQKARAKSVRKLVISSRDRERRKKG